MALGLYHLNITLDDIFLILFHKSSQEQERPEIHRWRPLKAAEADG